MHSSGSFNPVLQAEATALTPSAGRCPSLYRGSGWTGISSSGKIRSDIFVCGFYIPPPPQFSFHLCLLDHDLFFMGLSRKVKALLSKISNLCNATWRCSMVTTTIQSQMDEQLMALTVPVGRTRCHLTSVMLSFCSITCFLACFLCLHPC